MKKIITINTLKFDRRINRTWRAELLEQTNELLVFVGEFEKEVTHPSLGVIRPKTVSYEYYWLDRWYNVFRFHEPSGELRNFYCNVNFPPEFDGDTLNYVDLDIDLLVWKDFRSEVLDMAEFEENSAKFSYPPEVVENALTAVNKLQELIDMREFPFDFVE